MARAEFIGVRFFRYVVLKDNDCWIWIGSRGRGGYGQLRRDRSRSYIKSHVLAHEMFIGPVPHGMLVCHKCDNPPCCNPEHLFLGTHKENAQDAKLKGRLKRKRLIFGDEHPRTIVLVSQRDEIKMRYKNGESQQQLARAFGVGQTRISQIILAGKPPKYAKYRTPEVELQIRNLIASRVRQKDIAAMFGITQGAVSRIAVRMKGTS